MGVALGASRILSAGDARDKSGPSLDGMDVKAAPLPWTNRRTKTERCQAIAVTASAMPVDKLGAMTTVLILILICLVGSALLGFRGYWS